MLRNHANLLGSQVQRTHKSIVKHSFTNHIVPYTKIDVPKLAGYYLPGCPHFVTILANAFRESVSTTWTASRVLSRHLVAGIGDFWTALPAA
jgi:hypothetical protein